MSKREQDIWREALRATSLGWDLALPIFGGVLIGYLLDRALTTTYVFTLGLLLLGIVTGFYNVTRSIQRVDERSRRRAAEKKEQTKKENGTTT
jgi:F0F1-type ATP synthase assembly protein I